MNEEKQREEHQILFNESVNEWIKEVNIEIDNIDIRLNHLVREVHQQNERIGILYEQIHTLTIVLQTYIRNHHKKEYLKGIEK